MTYTFGQASTNKVGAVGGEQPEAQTPRYTFGQASGSIQQAAPVEEKTLGRKTAEVLAPSTTNLSDYVRASTRLKSGEVANIQKEREAVQSGITQMEQMLPSRPDLAQSIAESKQRIAEIDKDVAGVVSKADKTTGQKVGMALGTGLELGSLPELASLGLGKAFGTASTKKVLEIAPKNKIVQAITKATTVAPKTAQQDLAYKLAPLSGKAKIIAKETAKVLPETLALGYGYDVSTGLQDKAEQPFAPGAGTVMGASIPVAIGTGRLVKNAMFKPAEKKIADIITRRERELYNIENNYSLLRKNMNFSKDANAASRRRIASTDILANAVDDTGTIRTTNPGGPVDQYRDQVLHGSEAIVRKNLEREGAYTTPDVIRKKIEKVIGDSRLTMDEKETAFSGIDKILTGFQRQYPDGKIPLVAIQDEKVNAGALAYRNLDPAIKTRLKALTRAYKEVLEESSNLNIKEMNDELAKYLKDITLLESLDGRKVKGGKLGKYFAQISGNLIGGATGSAIGGVPGAAIGTVVGGELASRIKGTALSRTLAGETGQVGVKSPVLKEAQQKATSPRLQLPAPKFGRDYVQSNKSGNLNQRYADTAITSNSGNINNSLPLTADKASAGDKLKRLLRQSPRGMVDLNAEIFPKKATSPAYKETGDLTTKILKSLEGKSTVSKQFILDATNRGELKQVERDLIRKLVQDEPNTVDVTKFANKVKAELLPLKVNKARDMFRSAQGTSGGRYENIALPDELRGNVKNYEERIYESPIKTSAGEVHFGQPKDKVEGYFGHTRIEDMADNQTRRVIEVQSDLYQKGGLEKENLSKDNGQYTLDEVRKISSLDDKGRVRMETREKELDKLRQYNDPTAHFRMIREEIKKAAEDGKTKLQFPTGETAMKIEGLGQGNLWRSRTETGARQGANAPTLRIDELKVGKEIYQHGEADRWIITDVLGDGKFKAVPKSETYVNRDIQNAVTGNLEKKQIPLTPEELRGHYRNEEFDISGKVDTNNPIYKFYNKEVRNYLNKFGGKEVKDDKGVSWIEIPIGKNSKGAVEAFGLLGAVGLGAAASGGEKAKAEGSAQTMPLLGNMPEEKQEAFLKKDENLLKGIYHPRGGVTVTEKDLSELEAILFGEISNRPLSKKMNEIRDIVNVALNRVENEGKTLKEVLQADNQFQAFKGKLYEMYKSGKAGQSVIEKEKVNAVRKVVDELRRGKFANTVGDNLSYAHLKDDTLKVYKNWSEQKKDLNNIK